MIKDLNVQNEAVNVSDFREGKQVKISAQHNDKAFGGIMLTMQGFCKS